MAKHISTDQTTLCCRSNDWPPLIELKKLREEAEAAGSARAQEITEITRGMRMALGLPHNKITISSKRQRRHVRPSNQAGSDASDDSARESQHQKSKVLRRKRPGQKSATETSTTREMSQNPWEGVSYLKIKQITPNLKKLVGLVETLPFELQVLSALYFDAIDSREDSIQDADNATFTWLLEEPVDPGLKDSMLIARQSLLDWLSGGRGVYHISGKPGSGKSTLFKFIAHHPRTKFEMQKWAGDKELIMASFYFWNSGSAMQTSFEGLQRSMLVQLLRRFPDQTAVLFPEAWDALSKPNDFGIIIPKHQLVKHTHILTAWMSILTPRKETPYRICMFIDGLDELTETEGVKFSTLADTCRTSTTTNENVKICLSSRPFQEILDILDPEQRIHLHELTSQDVRASASSAIVPLVQNHRTMDLAQNLVDIIVQKSEGVFVWVRTVLRYIQATVAKYAEPGAAQTLSDSVLTVLVGEVTAYPSDIDDLYNHLLGQLNNRSQLKSAMMFALVIKNPFSQPPNALWFEWIERLEEDENFPGISKYNPYTRDEVRAIHELVFGKLDDLTKGMLATHKNRRERKDGDQFYRQRVQFSHRTARDFFRTPQGVKFLDKLQMSTPSKGVEAASKPSSSDTAVACSSHPGSFKLDKMTIPTARKHDIKKATKPSSEHFARLRLSEIILAGKYRVMPGADPRRRRMYFSYVRSLWDLKDETSPNGLYQIPFHHMETLRRDLQTTEADKFGSAYAVSSFRSIGQMTISEDAEKPARFLHLALAFGQDYYVLQYLERGTLAVDESTVEAGAQGRRRRRTKPKQRDDLPHSDELSLLFTLLFRGLDRATTTTMLEALLPYVENPLASITIRPPVSNDFLAAVSQQASIIMVIATTAVLATQESYGMPFKAANDRQRGLTFDLLARILVFALEKPRASTATLDFVFFLSQQRAIDHRDKAFGMASVAVPPDSARAEMSALQPEPGPKEPPHSHTDGVDLQEEFYTTLAAVLAVFVDDRLLLERVCSLLPDDPSTAVLDAKSNISSHCVPANELDQYICTEVVSSDGLILGPACNLSFRIY